MLLIAYAWWQELLLVPGPYWGARTFKKWMHRTAVDSRDGWCHNQKIPPKASESFQIVTAGTKIAWYGRAFQSAYHSSRFCTFCKGVERKDWTNGWEVFQPMRSTPVLWSTYGCASLPTLPQDTLGYTALHLAAGDVPRWQRRTYFGRGCEWMWMMLSVQIGVYRCTLNFDS